MKVQTVKTQTNNLIWALKNIFSELFDDLSADVASLILQSENNVLVLIFQLPVTAHPFQIHLIEKVVNPVV